jgi:putative holliday junction resolvase
MKKNPIKYLGIDFGEKRIGLAVADSETRLATPFGVAGAMEEIKKIIISENIGKIIVGSPVVLGKELGPMSGKVDDFISELEKITDIPIESADERLTSRGADSLSGSKKEKAPRDAIAAMLILQGYLDSKK